MNIFKNIIANIVYFFYKKESYFHVYSINETIEKIIDDKCSVIRFGDGEMALIAGYGIDFQEYDKELSEQLRRVLGSNETSLLICIPDIFENLGKYTRPTIIGWKCHLLYARKYWKSICKRGCYYNAFLSRPYIFWEDKIQAKAYFKRFSKIYEGYDVLLVEGYFSRLGYGNDLFNNVKSVRRILCPTRHAFRKYHEILSEILKQDKNILIVFSLGPTAKILAFELYKAGYRVLDIGHIDIEYEWYLNGAKEEIRLKNKFVNEVKDGDKELYNIFDESYNNEIIAKIL